MALNRITYDAHNWVPDEVIRSSVLNHAETAITNIASNLSNTNSYIDGLNFTSNSGSNIKTPTTITQTNGQLNVIWDNIRQGTTSQSGVVSLSNTPSNLEDVAATPAGVQAAVDAGITAAVGLLDATITGFGPHKTLASLSEDNGIISATFQDIAIPYNAIANPPTLGAAAAKGIDTTITSTNSENLPTSAAVAAYVANSISGLSPGSGITGVQAGVGLIGTSYNDIYTISLNTASANALGGVKIGSTISINNGTINVPTASSETAGIIKVGTGLTIDSSGFLNANIISYSAGDGIDITNDTITNNGVISIEEGTDLGELIVNSNTSVLVPGLVEADPSNDTPGIVKLYDDIGNNYDGAVHQNGLTNILNTLIYNFGLTLQMPTSVTWSTENDLQATPNRFDNETTIVNIQKYRNGSWVAYNGEARSPGERFRALITRTVLGIVNVQAVGTEYVEPEPQEPQEEP